MTPHTHNRQEPMWTAEMSTGPEAAAQVERSAQASQPKSQTTEDSARSVMHPDHHDPDWRYYFGAMAG